MATKPVQLPRIATTAGRTLEPPENGASTTSKDNGWEEGTRPPPRMMNWWQNLTYLWCAWLDDIHNHDLAWMARQNFNRGLVSVAQSGSGLTGIETVGDGSGAGVVAFGGAGNSIGGSFFGSGTGPGIQAQGLDTGDGGQFGGGAGGRGVLGQSGGAGAPGVEGQGITGNTPGLRGVGSGTGAGCSATGGSSAGAGGSFAGGTSGGIGCAGLGNSGAPGGQFTGGSSGGTGCIGIGGTGGHGVTGTGQGAGTGVVGTGGATGIGVYGSSSGANPGMKCLNSGAGAALEVSTGNQVFTGVSPAAGADPGANNMAFGANQCKAWAHFKIGNNAQTIYDNINISSITIDPTGLLGVVTFARNMANANYSITWGLGENQRGVFVPRASKTVGGFDFQVTRHSTETIYDLTTASEHTLDFQVEGRQ